MYAWKPLTSMWGSSSSRGRHARTCSSSMPNWRGFPPIARPDPLLWKAGLTRSSTGTGAVPRAAPAWSTSRSSARDSQTTAWIPASRQATRSARVFPGPRKMMSVGSTPARSAVMSSVTEETSAPAPARCRKEQMLMLGFALSEYRMSMSTGSTSLSWCIVSASESAS